MKTTGVQVGKAQSIHEFQHLENVDQNEFHQWRLGIDLCFNHLSIQQQHGAVCLGINVFAVAV